MDPVNPPADPGATPPAAPPAVEPAKTDPPVPDGLGDAGKKALAEMRQQNKDLERQLKELQQRDPVKAIAEALGVKPAEAKADDLAATVTQLQQQMRDAELRAARLEVAAAKGLTPAQAARLQGTTRDELDADADQLKALFPTSTTPGTPAPDPSQGARGGAQALEAQLKAAQDKGDAREAIRIKQLLVEHRKPK